MSNTIHIHIREVYGRRRAYPVCETAQRFAALLGVKTLTLSQLRGIEHLGYSVQDAAGPVALSEGVCE